MKLYTYSASGVVVPEIAAGMPVVGPDSERPKQWKTYTIKLSASYRFDDGAPVTAYSFADALDRDAVPDLQSPALADMQEIVGLSAVVNSDADALAGVVALNNTTLQISTVTTEPALAKTLASPFFCPVLEDTAIAPGGVDHPASAGPYYVQADSPDQVVLKKNPYYSGPRKAVFDFISFSSGIPLLDCMQNVARGRADICLDGLPRAGEPASATSLVTKHTLLGSVGCLSWNPVTGIDLGDSCRR